MNHVSVSLRDFTATLYYTLVPSIPQQQSWMSKNMTHSLHCSQEVYSMSRANELVKNNKNMGDIAGWTSSIN